jgi:hypothetical protein
MEQKVGGTGSTSLSTGVPTTIISNPTHESSAEPEDLTLGKRKASQITNDPGATPSVTQKRKKRRKAGPEPISATDNSPIPSVPPETKTGQGTTLGNTARDVANTIAVAAPNQSTVSTTKKKKKRKNPGPTQTDSISPELAELHAQQADASEPAIAEPSKNKKPKTVVVDLSTVILSPATTQVRIDPLACEINNL